MGKAYKCDRCGNLFESKNPIDIHREVDNKHFSISVKRVSDGTRICQDICDDCKTAFLKFWRNDVAM